MTEEHEICAICLDDMDTPSYKQVEETVVEGECTRLACGHAMHTCCLVESLIKTEGKCVQCNVRNIDPYKDNLNWEERLEFEKVCFDKIKIIKKQPEVKEGITDYASFRRELQTKHKEFQKKVLDFKTELRKEMEIDELLKTIKKTKRQTTINFNKAIKKSRGVESTALSHLTTFTVNKWLFKESWQTQRIISRGYFNTFY
jgi:hypothetical protein